MMNWHFTACWQSGLPVRAAWIALLLVVVAAGSVPAAGIPSSDERFVEGLISRRLFTLAESFCQQQLSRQDLSQSEEASLAIALCRTYAQHALHSPSESRPDLWNAAFDAAAGFSRRHPDSGQRVLVDMQQALTLLARGELARQESEVGAPGAPSQDEARRELTRAISALRKTAQHVETMLRTADATPAADELSEAELLSLQRNIRFQQARAFRNQALCYPAGSAEQADSLMQAVTLLRPLATLETGDALVWNARLDEIVCLRLRGQLSDAAQRLKEIDTKSPPTKVRLRSRAEKVRILLAAKRLDDALGILRDGREIAGQTSAEFDLAHVETFVALWKQASNNNEAVEAKRWQQYSVNMLSSMEDLYGRYWTRRGELLLGAAAGSDSGAAGLEVLSRTAKNHYLRKEFEEAIAAYDRAAAAALQAGQKDQALELFYAAALIERQRGRLADSAARQRALAIRLPHQAKSPQIHLQAVLSAAQAARDGSSTSLEAYQNLLAEQIETWPAEESADQARIWQGRLAEHRGQLDTALAAFQSVRPNSQHHAEAVEGVARSVQKLLGQKREANQPTSELVAEGAKWFEDVILGSENRLPDRWSEPQRAAALHAARLHFERAAGGFTAARSILEAAIRANSQAPAAWQTDALSLLVIAQAGAGDLSQAQATLQATGDGSPAAQLELLRHLSKLGRAASPAVQQQLSQLQLKVVARLRGLRGQLSPEQQADLEMIDAAALAAAGNRAEALTRYRQLAQSYRERGDIQQTYAELLSATSDAKSSQAALQQWRLVLARCQPNSARWFHAKYGIASAQFRLGERQQAAQMIRLLRTLQPELGGPTMKAKFLKLLAAAER